MSSGEAELLPQLFWSDRWPVRTRVLMSGLSFTRGTKHLEIRLQSAGRRKLGLLQYHELPNCDSIPDSTLPYSVSDGALCLGIVVSRINNRPSPSIETMIFKPASTAKSILPVHSTPQFVLVTQAISTWHYRGMTPSQNMVLRSLFVEHQTMRGVGV
jgi:hypothetical protein